MSAIYEKLIEAYGTYRKQCEAIKDIEIAYQVKKEAHDKELTKLRAEHRFLLDTGRSGKIENYANEVQALATLQRRIGVSAKRIDDMVQEFSDFTEAHYNLVADYRRETERWAEKNFYPLRVPVVEVWRTLTAKLENGSKVWFVTKDEKPMCLKLAVISDLRSGNMPGQFSAVANGTGFSWRTSLACWDTAGKYTPAEFWTFPHVPDMSHEMQQTVIRAMLGSELVHFL